VNRNYALADVNEALPILMNDLIARGKRVESRAGATLELTHVGITLRNPLNREILLPVRKASIAAQIAETMWVLAGRNDVEFLARYLPRGKDFSDDGSTWRAGYGPRLRDFDGVDQIAYIIETLKASPESRQAVASIWDPRVDTTPGKDIACNNWLNFSARDRVLDLHVAIRSNDAMWGWSGINAFEWSTLLEVVASILEMKVGSLHFSTTSFHLYEQHWKKAGKIAYEGDLTDPYLADSPRFEGQSLESFDILAGKWFNLEEQIRNGTVYQDDVNGFPDPMMRSWLRVLQWWWSGDEVYLLPVRGTRLAEACLLSIQPSPPKDDFVEYVKALHRDKHAAYGNSWKKRGEMLGIMANIARKIDRLGTNSADETSADTAIDLLVYLCKYRWWLTDESLASAPILRSKTPAFTNYSDQTVPVDELLNYLKSCQGGPAVEEASVSTLEDRLTSDFEDLESLVVNNSMKRHILVDSMLNRAYRLAATLHP
jgi:thymidylate synthase